MTIVAVKHLLSPARAGAFGPLVLAACLRDADRRRATRAGALDRLRAGARDAVRPAPAPAAPSAPVAAAGARPPTRSSASPPRLHRARRRTARPCTSRRSRASRSSSTSTRRTRPPAAPRKRARSATRGRTCRKTGRGARRRLGRHARLAQGLRRAPEAAVPARERSRRLDRQAAYGVPFESTTSGRPFVVGADGNVNKMYRKVDVTVHAQQILDDLKHGS